MARLIDVEVFMKNFEKEIENGATDVFDAVEDALEETPTINPVKHGKWIISSDGYYPYCSECGFRPEGRMTDFCGGCGARMDGDSE